jgi:PKD repeat protein
LPKNGRQAMVPVRPVLPLIFITVAMAIAIAPSTAFALEADFSVDPDSPLTYQSVEFTGEASDVIVGATIQSWSWDLDGDGEFDDEQGQVVSSSFSRPGDRVVRLEVTDSFGNQDTEARSITIGDRAPSASIAAIPSNPVAGQPVTFFSTSTDPDGWIKSQSWDLDGDGRSDSTKVYVEKTFPRAGQYTVRLTVTDDSNVSATSRVSVVVADAAPGGLIIERSGQPPGSASALRLMAPFPIVRMSGLVRRAGIKLRLLSVSAPVGASVALRCRGRGCPFRHRNKVVKPRDPKKGSGASGSAGVVRMRRFGHRLLRVGAVIRVLVSSPGSVGKYTRFRIRRGRVPARKDRCLPPGGKTPIRCPTA